MIAQGKALMCARDYLCTAHPDHCLAKLLIGNVRPVIMAWLLILSLAVIK